MARNHFAACMLALVAFSAACSGSDTADQEATANAAAKAVRDSLRNARTMTATTAAAAAAGDSAAAPGDTIAEATTKVGGTTSLAIIDSASADSAERASETEVLRETFAYAGGTRDPFSSLVNAKNAGPELVDLQLVGIYQDLRTSGNSVAVVREKDSGKRHKLRAGDRIGRLRVAQIRSKDVVFQIEDFGFERQETLSLRKQEDVTP